MIRVHGRIRAFEMMHSLGKLFLKGLAVVIPAALTVAILWWLAVGAERLLGGLLARFLPAGWYVPGMGLVAGLAITVLIGLLSHVLVFQRLFAIGERLLHRLPLVKSIYIAIKDFVDYLSPDSKREMNKVVLVRLPGQPFEMLGFVTREEFDGLPFRPGAEDPVAVYLPMSYQIGGYTLILPRSALTPVEMSFEDGMRLVLTAGVSRNAHDQR